MNIYEQLNKINDEESLKDARELSEFFGRKKKVGGDEWIGGGKYTLHIAGSGEHDFPFERRFKGFKLWSPEEAASWAKNLLSVEYPDNILYEYADNLPNKGVPIENVWVEVYCLVKTKNGTETYSSQFLVGNVSEEYKREIAEEMSEGNPEVTDYWKLHTETEQLPYGWWLD